MTPFDYAKARRNMVDNEVRTNDVTDPVLIAALDTIPKERFVREADAKLAYGGRVIDVGASRFLLDPRTFAKLVQAAAIRATDLVLDVGAATGYSTAVIARLCDTVVGIESDAGLVAKASDLLPAVGADNAAVLQADLKAGAASQGPFDVIVVEGMVDAVPHAIKSQLKEGGRLVTIENNGPFGSAMLYERAGNTLSGRRIFDATVPALAGFERPKAFIF